MSGRQYLPNTPEDRQAMLAALGLASVEELFSDIPEAVRFNRDLNLPAGLSEWEAMRELRTRAGRNLTVDEAACFLGAGYYDHYVPSVVRHLASRAEFVTAYTQYQPEISQGALQALWEYQSMICELTGLDVSNASLYDGGTALAEAMNMCCGITNRKKVLVSVGVNPFYRRILATYAHDLGFEIMDIPTVNGITDYAAAEKMLDKQTAGVIVQSPNFFGCIEQPEPLVAATHAVGALFVMSVNPIALALLKSPGELGADIAVGEGQPLGLGLNFGGPGLGFMAVREKFMRRMPGRIVGQTVDKEGRRGFVLTLQAREQHIRREKAYSNICSNEALCALTAAIYLAVVGKQGLVDVARLCLDKAHYAAGKISAIEGYELAFPAPFFHEFVIKTPRPVAEINQALLAHKIIGGFDLGQVDGRLANHMLLAVTEKRTREEIDALAAVLEGQK